MTIIPFDEASFIWGQAGIPGSGITGAEKTSFQNRLTALEAIVPATTLAQLGDAAIAAPATGQILRYNGTKWANYTPPAQNIAFGLPFVFDGGGAVLTTGTWFSNIEIPFACQLTGYTLIGSPTGSAVLTVYRSSYGAHPTYTDISGTEKPTLASQVKSQNLTISSWTRNLSAGDLLRITLDSVATTNYMTLNLRFTRTL